ncbi:poly-beta-1,6-N-acetyl-D-glucosamine biosynthesis protein PgaD [Castellaniella ginsengisoli]|uniref:Poly-beta-1,6-N-acetyl-D-glucosamine biosynthesis protein PgaD n=1 Tax=Castellaniella ginsengisoli TaxID=546114 RepID=A0AB39CXW6_9BURK
MMMIVKTPRSTLASVIDGLLTALAWTAFCFLLASGVHTLALDPAHAAGLSATQALPNAQTLLAYTLAGAWIGLLLAAWACYNAVRFSGLDRRKPPGDTLPAALADHFGISLTQLRILHASRTILFHHTDEGRICMIDFVHSPEVYSGCMQMKQ